MPENRLFVDLLVISYQIIMFDFQRAKSNVQNISHLSNFKCENNLTRYKSYGEMIGYVLDKRGLKRGWLADKLDTNNSQISRWINEGVTPLEHTRNKIDTLLNIDYRKEGGQWILISDRSVKNQEKPTEDTETARSKALSYIRSKEDEGSLDTDLDLLLRDLEDQLQENTRMVRIVREMIRLRAGRRDNDS